MNNYTDYISHHGIKGQKWGVRRYQNTDGSYTQAGSKRYGIAKKVAIGTGVALSAAYLANHPDQIPKILSAAGKTGKTAYSIGKNSFIKGAPKAGAYVGKKLGNATNKIEDRADKAVDKMIDAAILSVGSIAVSKIVDKYSDANATTESQKHRNKLIRDISTTGISAVSGSNKGNRTENTKKSRTNHQSTASGHEISNKLGKPSNKSINKNSSEWQALFKDANGKPRDADTRATIKSLANKGYDIDQINKYLSHDDFLEHHGVKGQRWGVRRYRNADGSLTPAGERRQSRQAQSAMRGEAHISSYRPTNARLVTSFIGRQYIANTAVKTISNTMSDLGYDSQAKTLVNAYRTLTIADIMLTAGKMYDINNYNKKQYQ